MERLTQQGAERLHTYIYSTLVSATQLFTRMRAPSPILHQDLALPVTFPVTVCAIVTYACIVSA